MVEVVLGASDYDRQDNRFDTQPSHFHALYSQSSD